jgi:glycosyltransferase involved in cell wall biosynthesis
MARPIKVVRIIARLNTGGPAIHTILLTRALDGGRFTSRLVTGVVGPNEGDMAYYAQERGIVPCVIPELGRAVAPGDDLRALVKLFRLLRREQPDIIHTHTAKAGLLGRVAGVAHNILAALAGVPRARIVHTFHGHVFDGYYTPGVSRVLVLAERVLAAVTDRVIAISGTIRDDLVTRYRVCPEPKVSVVSLGLDFSWTEALDDAAGSLRSAHGLAANAILIGIVGRLTDVKNHVLMLEAYARLACRDVRLVVIGDGELRPALEDAVRRLGLDGRVVFAGWKRDPASIYADLDLVCLTSKNEGTPVALIEAMAAGLPFVSTRVGGVPDLVIGPPIEHRDGFALFGNGILVPPGDARVLGAALDYLVARPETRRAMGSVGRASVLKGFSQERLAHDIETVYLDLVASEGAKPNEIAHLRTGLQ